MRAGTRIICRRELTSYFSTPLAYVFLVIFLILSGVFTFYLGGFYERNQADLRPFFDYHPWLYLFLIPAVAMRLWAEERKTGTIEYLINHVIAFDGIADGLVVVDAPLDEYLDHAVLKLRTDALIIERQLAQCQQIRDLQVAA